MCGPIGALPPTRTSIYPVTFWAGLSLLLLASRLAHLNILWADEDYHLAVAIQTLHGKMLYRDIWYDKPPLSALLFMLFGAWPGWPLRLVSTLLEIGGCVVAYRFASALWTRYEGFAAAGLYAFFHVFYFAHAVIPVEPDTLMMLPHMLAVYWAWQKKPLWSGVMAGIAFLLNTKGAFVLAACFVFYPASYTAGWLALLAGFVLPNAVAGAWLFSQGAFPDYVNQVWRWGFLYAASPQPEPPFAALFRLFGWFGFHAALVTGTIVSAIMLRDRSLRFKLIAWFGISFMAAAIGWRMPPRYLDQMIPALILMAAFGVVAILRRKQSIGIVILAAALLVPLIRFGPRYAQLIAEDLHGQGHDWSDTTMDRESRTAAELVNRAARPGDTVFIWGYRPNIVAYTRLPIAGQMWDSQPITMVPADRHLRVNDPLDSEWARENRQALIRTTPSIIVDGLSAYNPELDIRKVPELSGWFARYCQIGEAASGMSGPPAGVRIYRLCEQRYP
ncbi:MAG: glycosyltransferase family 39 protein [Acidobacteriota bacterium]